MNHVYFGGKTVNEKQLILEIADTYGFREEKIRILSADTDNIHFVVCGIKYWSYRLSDGTLAAPVVEGYTDTSYTWKGSPVTEEYYKTHIEGKEIQLFQCVDPVCFKYEPVDRRFTSEAEVVAYISIQHNPALFHYNILE